jgi:FtsH-binding integral membrane protein
MSNESNPARAEAKQFLSEVTLAFALGLLTLALACAGFSASTTAPAHAATQGPQTVTTR